MIEKNIKSKAINKLKFLNLNELSKRDLFPEKTKKANENLSKISKEELKKLSYSNL